MMLRPKLVVSVVCVLTVSTIAAVAFNAPPTMRQPDLSNYVLTKLRKLFSIEYGRALSQVGMFIPPPGVEDAGDVMGPSDFAIGFDGSIYIGDEQNGKVKKFSRDGRLLMATEGNIDRIAAMTIDKQGRVYVIHGTMSNLISVYDSQGRRLPEVQEKIMEAVRKLASSQKQLWEDIFGRSYGPYDGLPSGEVVSDEEGNLYFFEGRRATIKVRSDLTQAQIFKGTLAPLGLGLCYSYRYLAPERQIDALIYDAKGSLVNRVPLGAFRRLEVTVYKADGTVMRKFILPKRQWNKAEQLAPIGGTTILADRRGHFYTKRSPEVLHAVALRADNPFFCVGRYYAVFEYDEDGDFVGVRAIINGPPCIMVSWFKVDAEGNIYWLDFKADHVNVMMAPVPQ